MATINLYKNAKAILRGETTIYTSPISGTSIIKSIRVSNNDETNDRVVSLSITDANSVVYILEVGRTIQSKTSQELLASGNLDQNTADSSTSSTAPIILQSSEILKATSTGSDIHLIASILEMI